MSAVQAIRGIGSIHQRQFVPEHLLPKCVTQVHPVTGASVLLIRCVCADQRMTGGGVMYLPASELKRYWHERCADCQQCGDLCIKMSVSSYQPHQE